MVLTKNKRLFLFSSLLLCVVLSGVTGITLADGVKITAETSVLKDSYVIDNMRCYLSDPSKGFASLMFGKGSGGYIVCMADLLFSATSLIYQLFDFLVNKLYTMDIFGQLNTIVSSLTNNLWGTLKANYAGFIIVIGLFSVTKMFFLENTKGALIHLGKIILVLVIAGIWFPNTSNYLNTLNDYSFEFQAKLLEVAGQTDATSALSGGGTASAEDSNTAATTIIRNELFKQAIYRPFLLMNYGTTDASKINSMYAKVKDKDIPKNNNGEYLISKKFGKLSSEKKIEKLKAIAKYDNYLTEEKAAYKFIIALVSLFGVFLAGIPICAIACLNMFLQLLAIMYQYILPLIAIVSLMPRFSDGLINSIGNVIKIFLGKAVLAIIVILFCLINTTIDLLVPPTGFLAVLGNIFIKALVYWLLWHFRGWIMQSLIKAITGHGGNVKLNMKQANEGFQSTINDSMDGLDSLKEGAEDTARSAALMMAGMPEGEFVDPDFEVVDEGAMSQDQELEGLEEPTELVDDDEAQDAEREEGQGISEGVDEATEENEEADEEQQTPPASQTIDPELDEGELEVDVNDRDLADVEVDDTDLSEVEIDDAEFEGHLSEDGTISECGEMNSNDETLHKVESNSFIDGEDERSSVSLNSEDRYERQASQEYSGRAERQAHDQSTHENSGGTTKNDVGRPMHEASKQPQVNVLQQIHTGDRKTVVNQTQHNEQHADVDVHNHSTNKVSTNDFERLLRKYRGNSKR